MHNRPLPELALYLERLAKNNFAAKTIIDVGACYGTLELIGTFPDAYHIFIEPQPQLIPGLNRWLEVLDGEVHTCALSDNAGTATMQPTGASGSLLHPGPLRVEVETLDALLNGRTLMRPAILKTDCQGKDLAVLRGAQNILPQIDLVLCETSLYPPAGIAAEGIFHEVISDLTAFGFLLHDIVGHHIRPPDGALAQLDLAFMRATNPLMAYRSWD